MLTKASIQAIAETHGFAVSFEADQGACIRLILEDESTAERITFNIWPGSREQDLLRGIIAAREMVGRPVVMN